MKIGVLLEEFYDENNIPNGGIDKDTFELKLFGFSINVPNPEFRKRVTYIHDLHHLINKKDTSWKGEAYISGWEIATGIGKHFPVCLLSIWAMGYSLWLFPREVFVGYKEGLKYHGPIGMNISKAEYMQMNLQQLKAVLMREKPAKMDLVHWIYFLFFVILGQVLFALPAIALITLLLINFI